MGKIQLEWPAQVQSIQVGAFQNDVASQIEALNSKLSTPLFNMGSSGSGSSISITKVSSFDQGTGSLMEDADLSYVHLESQGVTARDGSGSGTMIAGRATLSTDQCRVELASFLFEEKYKDLLTSVLWHELGHCGGLLHLSSAGEIMSPMTLPLTNYNSAKQLRFFNDLVASIKQN